MFTYRSSRFPGPRPLAWALGLVCLTVAFPAVAAPPARKACDQQDPYERVECRRNAVVDQLEYTSETIFSPGSKLTGRVLSHGNVSRLQHIKNSNAQGQRAKMKYGRDMFKKMAKNEAKATRNACHLVPLRASDDANDDGICDYEQGDSQAECAAVELNPADGSLQKCNPEKKNRGKGKPAGNPKFEGLECDLSCDQGPEPDDAAESLDMEGAAEQMEGTFGAVEEDLLEMNTHLAIVEQNLPEEGLRVRVSQAGCVFPQLTPGLAEAAAVLRGLTAAVQGAASIADSGTGQTAVAVGFGGNARAAAIIADAAALAVELSYITIDEILSSENGALQTATLECTIKLAGDIAEMQALMIQQHHDIMDNDDQNTAELMNKIELVRAEMYRLLNTPQGRREAWQD